MAAAWAGAAAVPEDHLAFRAEGRRRLYSLEPSRLQPFHEWLAKYERALNERLDRMDDYLKELQQEGEPQ